MLLRRLDLFLIGITLISDQASKCVILMSNLIDEPITVMPFFNLVLRFNTGVSFSMLNTWPYWQLLLLALSILVFIVYTYIRSTHDLEKKGLSLIFAGALSNMIDRLHLKGVVDFLDFHLLGYHWPAFNIADSAIVCGCGLLLFSELYKKRKKINNA